MITVSRTVLVQKLIVAQLNCAEIGCEVGDWIQLAQYKDQWRTVVNIVMNIRVLLWNFMTS